MKWPKLTPAWGFAGLGLMALLGYGAREAWIASGACWTCWSGGGHHHHAEPPAWRKLRHLHTAQLEFRDRDLDRDSVRQFWRADVSGLYCLVPRDANDMLRGIPLAMAGADLAPVGTADPGVPGPAIVNMSQIMSPMPLGGYWFTALRFDDEMPGKLDEDRFAFCAVPESLADGSHVVAITHEGVLWRRRARGPRDVPPVFPLHPERAGWERYCP